MQKEKRKGEGKKKLSYLHTVGRRGREEKEMEGGQERTENVEGERGERE